MASKVIEPTFVAHIGAPVRFGNRIYILPPLNLIETQAVVEKSETMKDMSQEQVFAFMADVVHQSVVKNYPDVTLDQVKNEFLNSWNFRDVYELVLNKSGIIGEPTDEEMDLGKYRELLARQKQSD